MLRASSRDEGRPHAMLYAGLDLSRKRLDFCLLDQLGEKVEVGAAPPDADGLRGLAGRVARFAEPVRAAIESMNGARFVHDQLEQAGWQVEIGDAVKVKGLAPLACKTDRIDAWVLAELARRDLVPAIWLPDPQVPAERERARWRLHVVRHRSSLKQRVHAVVAYRRQALSRLRSVRSAWPPAARRARPAGAVARDDRGQPASQSTSSSARSARASASCAGSAPTIATC